MRTKAEIMKDFLEATLHGANMSTIRDKARLNYKTATRYLMLANDNEYIQHENGIFITTTKGKVFIEMATELDMV